MARTVSMEKIPLLGNDSAVLKRESATTPLSFRNDKQAVVKNPGPSVAGFTTLMAFSANNPCTASETADVHGPPTSETTEAHLTGVGRSKTRVCTRLEPLTKPTDRPSLRANCRRNDKDALPPGRPVMEREGAKLGCQERCRSLRPDAWACEVENSFSFLPRWLLLKGCVRVFRS